jgi:FlaG/FlaF family flagellin (archaellin)
MNMISKLLKNRYALSTVVTTLIILVISVLLASVVTYFAINVVSTRVQEESLHLTKQHIWHNSTGTAGEVSYSQASLMVINTGGRDIVIDKLAVRGQECAWNNSDTSNKQLVLYCTTNSPISADMSYIYNFNTTGTNTVTFDGSERTFAVASSDLVLQSGYTLLLYIVNPDSITINDIGLTVSITLYTAQAMYYREANVQAVSS